MATSKDNEVLIAPDGAVAVQTQPFRPDETSARPNPVALEVPVSVNGARTVEGSDKREPFSETTKTVLVFGNGAVIRLSSPVAAGQLLFLTNEKTKKEVVCQVVKSKNYRNVSGYVELEFTESVVGFWGMRFPTDRTIASVAPTASGSVPAAPVAKVNPVAPAPIAVKPQVPVVSATPKAPEVKAIPVPPMPAPMIPPPAGLSTPAPVAAQPPQAAAPKAPASVTPIAKTPEAAPPHNIASSLASSVASLLASPEVPPAGVPAKPAAPAQGNPSAAKMAGDASTEELKQQAARLQEQLSSMLFGATSADNAAAPAQREGKPDLAPSLTTKVLEMAKPDVAVPRPLPLLRTAPPPKSSLDAEEVKIPSWLEPLARNAAAPVSTQELIEREKARHAAELAAHEEAKPEPLAAPPPPPPAEPEQLGGVGIGVGSLLPLEGDLLAQPAPPSSGKGLWIAIGAVAVLAAAGGAWYLTHSSNGAAAAPSAISRTASPTAGSAAATLPASQPAVQPAPAPQTAVASAQPVSRPPAASLPAANSPAANNTVTSQPIPAAHDNSRGGSATPVPAASTERIARTPAAPEPAKPEPKKSSIGDVHLASPTVSRPASADKDDGVAAPSIAADPSASGLGSDFASGSKQPSAPAVPLPIGGDVKPARLLNSTPPIYPSLAKTQHVSGAVAIDALIDETGKVTTMKVLSGPALLRQSAMDAVRMWKYQPASLDGKAVPMHLTVTVQFRLQ